MGGVCLGLSLRDPLKFPEVGRLVRSSTTPGTFPAPSVPLPIPVSLSVLIVRGPCLMSIAVIIRLESVCQTLLSSSIRAGVVLGLSPQGARSGSCPPGLVPRLLFLCPGSAGFTGSSAHDPDRSKLAGLVLVASILPGGSNSAVLGLGEGQYLIGLLTSAGGIDPVRPNESVVVIMSIEQEVGYRVIVPVVNVVHYLLGCP